MTMYTEDVNYRMRAVFLIVSALSIALTLLLREALPAYPRMVAPVALVVFLCLFWLYDGLLWKLPGFKLLNFGAPPNLAGEWEGQLMRSVDGHQQAVQARLKIRQTWSKLLLELHTSEAVSRNVLAGFTLKNAEAVVMTWIYEIDGQKPGSLLDNGRGIVELVLRRPGPGDSMAGASLSGQFIESRPGEPLGLSFTRPGPFYWNPKPF